MLAVTAYDNRTLWKSVLTGFLAFIFTSPLVILLVHLGIRLTGVQTSYYGFSVSYDCTYCAEHHNVNTAIARFFFYWGGLVFEVLLFAIGCLLYRRSRMRSLNVVAIALLCASVFGFIVWLLYIPFHFKQMLWAFAHQPPYVWSRIIALLLGIVGIYLLLPLLRDREGRKFFFVAIITYKALGWGCVYVLPPMVKWLFYHAG